MNPITHTQTNETETAQHAAVEHSTAPSLEIPAEPPAVSVATAELPHVAPADGIAKTPIEVPMPSGGTAHLKSDAAPAPTETAKELSAQEQAAVQSLASSLASLTGKSAADLVPFATVYGPDALKWAQLEAQYKQSGDHPQYIAQANNLRQLQIAAIGAASKYGISAESISENTMLATLMAAGRFALGVAIAA